MKIRSDGVMLALPVYERRTRPMARSPATCMIKMNGWVTARCRALSHPFMPHQMVTNALGNPAAPPVMPPRKPATTSAMTGCRRTTMALRSSM